MSEVDAHGLQARLLNSCILAPQRSCFIPDRKPADGAPDEENASRSKGVTQQNLERKSLILPGNRADNAR